MKTFKSGMNLSQKIQDRKNIIVAIIIAIVIVILFVLSALPGKSQTTEPKWKLNSITMATGETPLTKGITISPVFSKGNHLLMVDVNSELGEFMYFYSVKKWFALGPSVGFFKNTTWVGPIWSFKLFNGHFNTLNWFGWSFGNPEFPGGGSTELKPSFMFSYHQFTGSYKWFEGYYILQHYQKIPPEHIFGGKLIIPLGEKFSVFGGYGYMLHAEKSLWSAGFVWNNPHF